MPYSPPPTTGHESATYRGGAIPRPELQPGQAGKITVKASGDVFIARARVKNQSNRLRSVTRQGPTEAAARKVLRAAIAAEAKRVESSTLGSKDRFDKLAELYLQRVRLRHSKTTYDRYKHALDRVLKPGLGHIRLDQCTPVALQRFFDDLADKYALNSRRSFRAPLSGAFALAVQLGAVTGNPVPTVDLEKSDRMPIRALTPEETRVIVSAARADHRIGQDELGDFVEFMLHTGCRISEALALTWDHVRVDDDTALVYFEWNVVHVIGEGLVLQRGKTAAARRTIQVTTRVRDILAKRATADHVDPHIPVFCDARGGYRNTNSMRRVLKHVYREAQHRVPHVDLSWVKQPTHVLRKTTATMMADAGVPDRQIADYLGHSSPVITQSFYIHQGRVSGAPADAISATLAPILKALEAA